MSFYYDDAELKNQVLKPEALRFPPHNQNAQSTYIFSNLNSQFAKEPINLQNTNPFILSPNNASTGYINYQSSRQTSSNSSSSSYTDSFISNSNLNNFDTNPSWPQFSDNLFGISSTLFQQTPSTNRSLTDADCRISHTFSNQFDLNKNNNNLVMTNEQFYDNEKSKLLQQYTDTTDATKKALNFFTEQNASQTLFDNIQYKYNQSQEANVQLQNQQYSNLKLSENNSSGKLDLSQGLAQTSSFYLDSDVNKIKRKVKKSRVLFSQWQINELEKLFKKQKYVTSNERDLISKRLRLNPNQVKIWFQNRRYKIKKKSS